MREKEVDELESQQHSQPVRKKCKKKRLPIDEDSDKQSRQRSDEEFKRRDRDEYGWESKKRRSPMAEDSDKQVRQRSDEESRRRDRREEEEGRRREREEFGWENKKRRSPNDEDSDKLSRQRCDEESRRRDRREEDEGKRRDREEFGWESKKRRSPTDEDSDKQGRQRSDDESRRRDRREEEEGRRRDREEFGWESKKRRSPTDEDSDKQTRKREDESRRKCNKHKRERVRIKEEPSESPQTRSRSPRERRQVSNMDSLVSTKEEKHDWGRADEEGRDKKKPMENKAKPDFGLSGKLVEETNVVNGVIIKYSEPEEARKPNVRWRLYPFKGESSLPVLHLHRQSAYLIGRDRKIADLPVDHPSCSKQHAVLQYRLVPYTRPNGTQGKRVRPYILDLESANGTFVNNKRIDAKKYVELLERDVIKFAFSSREYVLLHENSKDAHLDDDVQ